MKHIILIVTWLSFINLATAQTGNYESGAKSAAIAHASVTLSDEWAIFNNIGALSSQEDLKAFVSHKIPYGLNELSTSTLGIVYPITNGSIGLGIFRFGGELLNEHRVNIGYSSKVGLASLGINLSYYQLHIEDGGTSNTFMIDFGGRFQITPALVFGAHISNVNQAKTQESEDSKIPTYMKAGVSYLPTSSLILNLDIEKSLDTPLRAKLGLEYMVIDKLYLRTGLVNQPLNSSFGIGYSVHKTTIDYAYSIHPELGGTHQLSLSYNIK